MAHGETTIADIPNDLQKHIMKLLASTHGAADFVRATASCKEWKQFAEDTEMLKAVEFGTTYRNNKSFWQKNSFLHKCADAGNERAIDIVRKRRRDMITKFRVTVRMRYI